MSFSSLQIQMYTRMYLSVFSKNRGKNMFKQFKISYYKLHLIKLFFIASKTENT